MVEVVDYFQAEKRYEKQISTFLQDKTISKQNKDLVINWLKNKEETLNRGKDTSERELNNYRTKKTLVKYLFLLQNIAIWFPDLKKVTKAELEKFRDDFYNDKIKYRSGRAVKGKKDYITKIIKSHFFRTYLGHDKIVNEVFDFKVQEKESEVEFITYEDLQKLLKAARMPEHKTIMLLLFSTGVRIGEALNIRKNNFELKYSPDTKTHYYLLHLPKEITKTKRDRTIPLVLSEANENIKATLEKLDNDEILINMKHNSIISMIRGYCEETGVRTTPTKRIPSCHTFRKSCATYLLSELNYTTDEVKAILGHKPSSSVIDKYVNYLGKKHEPKVKQAQTNQLLQLQKVIEDNNNRMTIMQQENDKLKKKLNDALPVVTDLRDKVDMLMKLRLKEAGL